MNIRPIVQRKARPMSWRWRGQGEKSPHGPPVRLVAGNLQTKRGHNQTNYCLENCMEKPGQGLEGDWELAHDVVK